MKAYCAFWNSLCPQWLSFNKVYNWLKLWAQHRTQAVHALDCWWRLPLRQKYIKSEMELIFAQKKMSHRFLGIFFSLDKKRYYHSQPLNSLMMPCLRYCPMFPISKELFIIFVEIHENTHVEWAKKDWRYITFSKINIYPTNIFFIYRSACGNAFPVDMDPTVERCRRPFSLLFPLSVSLPHWWELITP